MATLTKPITAIEFLNNSEKTIDFDVYDHLNENDFFKFNNSNSGSESFNSKSIDLDWGDDFYFQISMMVSFDFTSWHRTTTHEEPEEKEIEFLNAKGLNVEILECQKYNDEFDEYESYFLSQEERKQVEEYFSNNIEISD